MASIRATWQIAGYASVANGGNAATGAGKLGATLVINHWTDGTFTFTDSNSNVIQINPSENIDFWKVIQTISQGANGIPTNLTNFSVGTSKS